MEELFFDYTKEEIREYKRSKRGLSAKQAAMYRRQLVLIIAAALVFLFTVFFVVKSVKAGESKPARYKSFVSVEVKAGDTVWSIAEANISEEYASVSELVKEIVKTNHLQNGRIDAGNYIIVPVYKASAE